MLRSRCLRMRKLMKDARTNVLRWSGEAVGQYGRVGGELLLSRPYFFFRMRGWCFILRKGPMLARIHGSLDDAFRTAASGIGVCVSRGVL